MGRLKKIPKLRFPEFEGEWETKKLGDVSTKKSSNISANKIEENFGDFIIYGASGILKKINFYKEENDYVSIVKDGAGVGRLLYCKGKSSVLGTMEIISPKQNIDTYFLYCLLSNIDFVKYVTGSTIPHIYFKDYSGEICGIPSFPEQQKIASFLTAVDYKLQALKHKLTLLEQYKKGVMQQIFSQELRFKPSPIEALEIGDEYPDWERGRFSKFIKLYRGSSPRPIIKYVTTSEDGINWIKIGDTKQSKNYRISSISEKITKKGSLKSRFVERGEIILANSMSFGKSYLLQIEGCIYDGWFVLREYEKAYDKEFLLQVLNSEFLQKQYFRLSTGGVVQNISSEIVYSTLLFRPVLEEQTKIASFLSAIDKKIEKTTQQLTQTETFKKGLLQKMFV